MSVDFVQLLHGRAKPGEDSPTQPPAMYDQGNTHQRACNDLHAPEPSRYENKVTFTRSPDSVEKEGMFYTPLKSHIAQPNLTCVSQMLNNPSLLPRFSGKESWEEFIWHFNFLTESEQWGMHESARALVSCFDGKARNILMELPEVKRRDYGAIINHFKTRCGAQGGVKACRAAFNSRTQEANETLNEYASEVKALGLRAYPNLDSSILDDLLLTQFMNGMQDDDLRRSMDSWTRRQLTTP